VVVPIGSDGAIRFSNAAGAVHLIGDIVGYFIRGTPSTSRTGRTLPLSTPFPAIDTRTPPTVGKLAGRVQETWDFTPFVSSVRASGAAAGAENGAWVNLAAFNLTTAYGTPPPSTTLTMYTNTPSVLSTALSLRRGEVTRSTTVIPYGGGNRVNVYNTAGFVDYALDVMAVILR